MSNEFLRTVGAQVTVNRMLSFESVKQRLGREQPLSFLEFNYMLLQVWARRPCFFPATGCPSWTFGDARRRHRLPNRRPTTSSSVYRRREESSSWAGPTSGANIAASRDFLELYAERRLASRRNCSEGRRRPWGQRLSAASNSQGASSRAR